MRLSDNGLPRRCRMDLWVPAERAIQAATDEVERAGCHPLLTDAVNLLAQARAKVADFVERETPTVGVSRYRTKPYEVEAVKYDGTRASFQATWEWMDGDSPSSPHLGYDGPDDDHPGSFDVRGEHGVFKCRPGDWVVRGEDGAFVVVPADAFLRFHEAAD